MFAPQTTSRRTRADHHMGHLKKVSSGPIAFGLGSRACRYSVCCWEETPTCSRGGKGNLPFALWHDAYTTDNVCLRTAGPRCGSVCRKQSCSAKIDIYPASWQFFWSNLWHKFVRSAAKGRGLATTSATRTMSPSGAGTSICAQCALRRRRATGACASVRPASAAARSPRPRSGRYDNRPSRTREGQLFGADGDSSVLLHDQLGARLRSNSRQL